MKEGFDVDGLCVKIYNPEEQKLVAVYENYSKAGNRLGLTPKVVAYHAQHKTRIFAPLLDMKVAVRLAKQEDTDIELIKITNLKGKL